MSLDVAQDVAAYFPVVALRPVAQNAVAWKNAVASTDVADACSSAAAQTSDVALELGVLLLAAAAAEDGEAVAQNGAVKTWNALVTWAGQVLQVIHGTLTVETYTVVGPNLVVASYKIQHAVVMSMEYYLETADAEHVEELEPAFEIAQAVAAQLVPAFEIARAAAALLAFEIAWMAAAWLDVALTAVVKDAVNYAVMFEERQAGWVVAAWIAAEFEPWYHLDKLDSLHVF